MTVRELIVELEKLGIDREVVCYDADDSHWYPPELPLTLDSEGRVLVGPDIPSLREWRHEDMQS